MNYDIKEPIYLVGDLHGQPRYLCTKIKEFGITNSAIIILGDIGLGFNDIHTGCCKFLNKSAEEDGNHFYLFRGNHDNPASYVGINKATTEEKYHNITLMNDFDTITTSDGKKGIIVGGGISIDRQYRVIGKSFWHDELVNYGFMPEEHYDFVLAHSGPTPPCLNPNAPFFKKMVTSDPGLVKQLADEQEYFTKFIDKVKPERWYNGHYHWSGSETFEFRGTMVSVLGEASDETEIMGRSFMCQLQ